MDNCRETHSHRSGLVREPPPVCRAEAAHGDVRARHRANVVDPVNDVAADRFAASCTVEILDVTGNLEFS
jgi:hypothetical protein